MSDCEWDQVEDTYTRIIIWDSESYEGRAQEKKVAEALYCSDPDDLFEQARAAIEALREGL